VSLLQRLIAKVVAREDLSRGEMVDAITHIMDGEATQAQIGGFLMALRTKGESVDELVGAASAMRTRALSINCPHVEHSIDTCGTGGDGSGTVNISTLAALLVAACGGYVAKHGNRAQTSKCGSADVLEALGVVADAEPEIVERCLEYARVGFLFAPRFHSATRHVSSARRELGTRTIFNLLGPLTNPAFVHHQIIGVYDRRWCEPLAAALGALGLRRAAVVHGAGNLDEIAVRGETHDAIWDDGVVDSLTLTPKQFGLDEVDPAGLAGGDAAQNASILRKVLAGHQVDHGERLEAVLHAGAMTAALALELLEPGALDLDRLPDQTIRAITVARDGEARLALHRWTEASHAPLDADLSDLMTKTAADFRGVE